MTRSCDRKPYRLIGAICAALLLVGCSAKQDTSFILDSVTCLPPCWNGIEPGETPKESVPGLLKAVQWVDPDSISTSYARQLFYPNYFRWRANLNTDVYGEVTLEQEVVQSISLGNLHISLETLIQEYGYPENLLMLPDGNEVQVFLVYPDSGLWLAYFDKLNAQYALDVEPGETITAITFLSESSAEEYFYYIFGKYMEIYGLSKPDIYQLWEGFGVYKFSYGFN